MKTPLLSILLSLSIVLSLTPAFGSSIQTNQMVCTSFEPLSRSDSNFVAVVKESIAHHLTGPFTGVTNSGGLLRTTVWELVSDSGIPEKIPDGDIVFFKERKRLFRPHTKWTYQTSYRWVAIYTDSIPNLSIFPSTFTVGSLVSTELVFTTTVGSPFQSAFGITAEDITAELHSDIRYKSKQIKPSSVTPYLKETIKAHTKLDYYHYQLVATVTVTKLVGNKYQPTDVETFDIPLCKFNDRLVCWELVNNPNTLSEQAHALESMGISTEANIANIRTALSTGAKEVANSCFLLKNNEAVSYIRNKVQLDLIKKIRQQKMTDIRFLSYHVGGWSGTETGYNDSVLITNDKIFNGNVNVLFFREQRGEVAPGRLRLDEYPANPAISNELDALLPVLDSLENGPMFPMGGGSILCIIYKKPTSDMRCVFMLYPQGYSTNSVALLNFLTHIEKYTENIESVGSTGE